MSVSGRRYWQWGTVGLWEDTAGRRVKWEEGEGGGEWEEVKILM